MIAMRYGSLPIVHETGGLKDTVEPYNQFTNEGCGFTFSRFDGDDALEACRRALAVYNADGEETTSDSEITAKTADSPSSSKGSKGDAAADKEDGNAMTLLIRNAMKCDFGFERCAKSYAELYRKML